jgi:hypothetical protein
MMKHEFEERIGAELTPEQYEIVERVYTWHPAIPNVGGKDKLAELYRLGGMDLIEDMDNRAYAREYEYNSICDRLREVVSQKSILLDRMADLQKELNAMSAEFDELTAQTEQLQMRKEAFDRGN